ncbi:hypothetical protein [Corynebacterium sphenisci]|uniref:hypothetical protein n=1 Tax=Corynebacterium sphenisci TaxID=191493 RepID=UPI000952075D|nr:hypothetical protein [Corynebacterium sphenisci]
MSTNTSATGAHRSTRTPSPARRSRRGALRAAAAALLLPAVALAGAPAASAATDLDPSLPDYPRIRAVDGFTAGSGKSTIHCVGTERTLTCQTPWTWTQRRDTGKRKGNTLEFNLRKATTTVHSADMDIRNMKFKKLPKGQKYEYQGHVVLYQGGKLYFSSPKFGVRGELNKKGVDFPIRTSG